MIEPGVQIQDLLNILLICPSIKYFDAVNCLNGTNSLKGEPRMIPHTAHEGHSAQIHTDSQKQRNFFTDHSAAGVDLTIFKEE